MQTAFRQYRPGDFISIRRLLAESFEETNPLGNWLIDRWNFCRTVSQTMHDTFDTWGETVGIWEDDAGEILGVVNSEGEGRGEAFFQQRRPLPTSVLEEMFDYAERILPTRDQGKRLLRLRIPEQDATRESIALRRGYRRLDWEDSLSKLTLPADGPEPLPLPAGFRFASGSEVSASAKAVAHAKAFGYYDGSAASTFPLAFERMKTAPDYRPELDLAVVDEWDEIAAFCTLWYDARNRHGILEPVGTLPAHRLQGLGRAVIGEGLRRMAGYGAQAAYVGSTMDFYKRLGFERMFRSFVWEKILEG